MHRLKSLLTSIKSGCLIDYDREMLLVQVFTHLQFTVAVRK